jgi:polyisoprenoid-binding protein YceI
MPIEHGTYRLGPDNARLMVDTSRTGGAARAAHDLSIEVTSWSAQLEVEDSGASATLSADGASLRVLAGHGGIQALGEDDKDNIRQTIDDEILRHSRIEFRSTAVQVSADGNDLDVEGELELAGATHAISFRLTADPEGNLIGRAKVKQTEWGIKPYSALFGALKVADEVEVIIDAQLASAD